jgi:predicted AAA+ superfamily ATPase
MKSINTRTGIRNLKNIHDSYPDGKIVFSGSSSMNLIRDTYDLSRRGSLFKLGGMSFLEYLEFLLDRTIPNIGFNDLLKNPEGLLEKLAGIDRIKGYFLEYLECGYYPFLFEDKENYHQKILNVMDKTIYEDISAFYTKTDINTIGSPAPPAPGQCPLIIDHCYLNPDPIFYPSLIIC